MKIGWKNILLSSFFGSLGPLFNKKATLDTSTYIYGLFIQHDVRWMIHPYNVLCIVLMILANSIAVKYKMLTYKCDGAFIGTTFIFILGYFFSLGFDFINDQKTPDLKRVGGAALVILGICLIALQEQEDNIDKFTPSIAFIIDTSLSTSSPIEEDPINSYTNNDGPILDRRDSDLIPSYKYDIDTHGVLVISKSDSHTAQFSESSPC